MEKFKNWLSAPENGTVLGVFRAFFGLMMAYQTFKYHKSGLVDVGLLQPKILFHYEGLAFLQPMPLAWMNACLLLMGVSTVLIALGLLFRPACAVLTVLHAYIFLIDKAIFNNHIYLFVLVSFLLAFTDADRFFSVRGNRGFGPTVPHWQVFLFQFQLAILYFYGGLAKINYDWLVRMEPLHSMLRFIPEGSTGWPGFVKYTVPEWFFSYSGVLFDLLIPFLLWYKPTRYWSLAPLLFFHLSNSTVFRDIGIFPFFSIGSTLIFFPDLKIFQPGGLLAPKTAAAAVARPVIAPLARKILLAYFVWQLLFPFRGLFLPNPIDYSTVANRFSWRMKNHSRRVMQVNFTVEDPLSKQALQVPVNTIVNTMQMNTLGHDPRAVLEFARYVEAEAKRRGLPRPVVKAQIRIEYNGWPEQFFIDPNVDLTKVTYSPFAKIDWIVPLPAH